MGLSAAVPPTVTTSTDRNESCSRRVQYRSVQEQAFGPARWKARGTSHSARGVTALVRVLSIQAVIIEPDDLAFRQAPVTVTRRYDGSADLGGDVLSGL